jgi:hypothetical protein
MNLNDFAKEVTLIEGKAQSLSIAQVKEVLRITFTALAKLPEKELKKILAKYEK